MEMKKGLIFCKTFEQHFEARKYTPWAKLGAQ